jgi:hypothetical protein
MSDRLEELKAALKGTYEIKRGLGGELPIAETVRIIREVTDALAFAHSK